MSIAQKFTWGDFLKQNPALKEKKVKRTSSEGEKAYQAAFKKFAKEHLKSREEKIKKETDRANKTKKDLLGRLKKVDGKKWHLKAKELNQRIGRFDAYLARLTKLEEKSKQLTKKI